MDESIKLAFQKGLENGWMSGKSQWKIREFWNGYWEATLMRNMVANILPTDAPLTPGLGSKGQTIYFSESSHVAYQIKGHWAQSTMKANMLSLHTPLPLMKVVILTLGWDLCLMIYLFL